MWSYDVYRCITSKEQNGACKIFLGARLRPGVFGWNRYALFFSKQWRLRWPRWFSRSQNDHQQLVDLWTRPSFAEHFSILLVVSSCINFVVVYNVHQCTTSNIIKRYRDLMKLTWSNSRGASCCQAAQQARGPRCSHVLTHTHTTELNDIEFVGF